jgi:hypothetical protein
VSAELKPKPSPPPVAGVREALEAHEAELIEARRANAFARSSVAFHKASGDAGLLEESRRTIASTGKKIAELEAAIEEDQATLVELQARARNQFNGDRYKVLSDLAIAAVKASTSLDEAIATFAATREKARETAAAFEAELSRCNITYDPFLSHATRLDSKTELALWAASDGLYGRARTMETPQQIRDSGRASIRAAATEFREVCLRSARATLGLG